MHLRSLALCCVMAVGGQAHALDKDITAKPWSEFAVDDVASRSNPDEYDVRIVAIDGSMEFDRKPIHRVTAGFHFLELASTKVGRRGELTSQPFAIEAKPCVRYELVAIHADRMSNRRWRLDVKKEVPIRACAEKFGLQVVEPGSTETAPATDNKATDASLPTP